MPSFPLVHHAALVLRPHAGHIQAADGAEVAVFVYDAIRAVVRRERTVAIGLEPRDGPDMLILATPNEAIARALESALRSRMPRA
jgi:hypothetical protein